MGREDLRQHGHQQPGDGGAINFADQARDDTPDSPTSGDGIAWKLADSGTLTVAANSNGVAQVSNVTRDSHLLLSAYPDDTWAAGNFATNNDNAQADAAALLIYDADASDQWEVFVAESGGTEITVTWEVYERA